MHDIIDVCCGGRMFWFDKQDPRVLFMDNRNLPKGSVEARKSFEIQPDLIGDFRKTEFSDNQFKVVVMDPPHLIKVGNGRMGNKYGKLPKERKTYLLEAFNEVMRILENRGILIFKRNDYDIPLHDIVSLFPIKPSLGQRTGKNNRTAWLIYIK